MAWELGCKGITVYRSGSREAEVLTAGKENQETETESNGQDSPTLVERSPRPRVVRGLTENIRTGQGNLYVTINFDNESNRPFEGVLRARQGGQRRVCPPRGHRQACFHVVTHGSRPGPNRRPVEGYYGRAGLGRRHPRQIGADAISLVLNKYITDKPTTDAPTAQIGLFPSTEPISYGDEVKFAGPLTGKRCPECSAYLIAQEGCLNCLDCGYSKCD